MQSDKPLDRTDVPLPENEQERIEELNSFDILYTHPEDAFDALANLSRRICNAPVALVTFIDSDQQFIKSSVGATLEDLPRSQSIDRYTIMSDQIFEITDLENDPRFSDNPYVAEEPHFRFYAGAPLITENGNPIGTLCVYDYEPNKLTEKQKEDLKTLADEVMTHLQLRKREKSLEKMNVFKDRLMKVISHDIRSPLTGITGAAEFLKESGLTAEERSELAEIITESAGQIQGIVSELLDSELVQFGELKSNPNPYDLIYGIEGIVNLFKLSARRKDISLSYSLEGDIPSVMIDEQYYECIIANLVSNAVKFTKRGGNVTIQCRYLENDEEANRLVTIVEDTGIGMSKEYLQNLFEKKEGGGRFGTDNESSHGMGMHIVKMLGDVCNADIHVDSEIGTGTTFRVDIPAPRV